VTYFVSFRTSVSGGEVGDPKVLVADETAENYRQVPEFGLVSLFAEKDILFATHGFNVNQAEGVRSLARLEARLNPVGAELFVGVLWPGDYWLPVVNYPTEAADAVKCGQKLADFCAKYASRSNSISFLSHSLGGRLILEAVAQLDTRAKTVCLTAAAVDRDCLDAQYADAVSNAETISNLSSRRDMVLRLAYPVGDFLSDIFYDDDDALQSALGYLGPKSPWPALVRPKKIPEALDYGHGDYLPPSDQQSPLSGLKWENAADFMFRAFRNQAQTWP